MRNIVVFQWLVALFFALIAAGFRGLEAFYAAFFGAFSCIFPNTLFAVYLALGRKKSVIARFISFFMAEFVKILLILSAVWATFSSYPGMALWIFLGFFLALKSQFFGMFFNSVSAEKNL